MNDARDTGNRARLAAVAGDAGCHACHTHMSCTRALPEADFADRGHRRTEARGDGGALKGELSDER